MDMDLMSGDPRKYYFYGRIVISKNKILSLDVKFSGINTMAELYFMDTFQWVADMVHVMKPANCDCVNLRYLK